MVGLLPPHYHLAKGFVFMMGKRFRKDICPIKMGVNFNKFDVALFNLITKVMPLEGNMFGVRFSTLELLASTMQEALSS
jgi:hypothetical protein